MTGKKKKKKQQQPAFCARIAQPQMRWQLVTPPAQQLNRTLTTPQQTQTFQAPHHQQESMVELTDDTSPNTPIGAWKPIGGGDATKNTPNVTPQSKLSFQATWQKFQQSLKSKPPRAGKPETKILEEIFLKKQTTEEKPSTSSNTEIFWEDDFPEISQATPTQNPTPSQVPKPDIIKGTASEIKISLQNNERKLTTVQKPIFAKKEVTTANMNKSAALPDAQKSSDFNLFHKQILPPSDVFLNAGVPKSFLSRQAGYGAIQPQRHDEDPVSISVPTQPVWSNRPSNGSQSNQTQASPNQPRTNPNQLQPTPNQPQPTPNQPQPTPPPEKRGQYSPSDTYDDSWQGEQEQDADGSESLESGQKRQSAFDRLGPLSQPKKPKLTINLLCSKDESVREVLDTTEEEDAYVPVHLRKDIIESKDETVIKYLPYWPWKKNIAYKNVTARVSKTAMILEQEQMEEAYEKDNAFIQVSVKGYPSHWKKEHVLDAVLDAVRGKNFIPCFTEFTPEVCKFLVLRCRPALLSIHKMGFYIRKDEVELAITISLTDKSLKHIDFIPRLVLRKQLAYGYDGERKLSLKEFTCKSDISHFIYFPLNRIVNQTELIQLQSTIAWDFLTDLDLSHNKITSIEGFELQKTTPKLKHLDLSYNYLERIPVLLSCREVALRSLKLEGNPLCMDYIDPYHYVRVVKMIFPGLVELDGVKIHLKGDLPVTKRNYCPTEAVDIATKFLEVFFPLLECQFEERLRIEELYHPNAVLTVSYRYSLRYSSLHRKFRNIFLRARMFDEGDEEAVEGAPAIARLIGNWPALQHDPATFTVDVMHHSESSTILRVGGVLKLTSETLAEDEHLLAFTRTLVLTTKNGAEYKIRNEMVYWDEPCKELANISFQFNAVRVRTKRLSLKFDTIPDDDLKEKLVDIFMKITEADKKISERCLESKEWDLKSALEYFMKLVKMNELDVLNKEVAET
ncbi:uncharacterized protein LOC126373286 isoform X2 [Pectinophora gossypiella]|uniref:uncharacterized protein LOC126373286 isoform X2 n=1 Tax=Pectinophora gossypiella TaxID=13191 RepID=UPI00214E8FC5|nr:uncharacterized protein LOC126373286 isoform X2 [Pectinophora gossypiella]